MSKTRMTVAAARKCHPLASAVLRQLGGGADAVQSAIDAANHGADGGFGGFITYAENERFATRHRAKIAAAVEELADDLGEDPIGLVRGFGCLKDDPPAVAAVSVALFGGRVPKGLEDDLLMVRNALAWFALEEVGRRIADD